LISLTGPGLVGGKLYMYFIFSTKKLCTIRRSDLSCTRGGSWNIQNLRSHCYFYSNLSRNIMQISFPPNLDFPHVDLIVGFPSTKLFCGQILKRTVLGIG
jgi:hypothetical protein